MHLGTGGHARARGGTNRILVVVLTGFWGLVSKAVIEREGSPL